MRCAAGIFFSSNFQANDPLSFRIMGNLGADASGTTHAFTFARRPFKGFVKAVCEATGASGTTADGDPSVNHLIIVDGGLTTGPLPPAPSMLTMPAV